jgi:hypothetical protein
MQRSKPIPFDDNTGRWLTMQQSVALVEADKA